MIAGRIIRAARPATAVAALVVAASLAGCGDGGGKHSIVLYNGQHPEVARALVTEFEQETGIQVQRRDNDTIVLAAQILQEGGHSPADVYLSENSPELMTLEERGVLAKLSVSTLAQVPAAYESPAGDWIGVALRVSSLVYNPALLPAAGLPQSILDLAQPKWKGKIALAPTDSDFPPVVGAVIARYGSAAAERWLKGIKANAATYQDEEAVAAAVNRGAVACGVINQYYWYRLRLELGKTGIHSALHYFRSGDPGSIVNISGAAVLASSHHSVEAERFVRFLVGKRAQQILARSDDFEYPSRPGVAPNSALAPLRSIAHTSLRAAELGNDQQAAKLIRESGLG